MINHSISFFSDGAITMQILRSYWYYWHTGNKLVAVISMILTTLVLWLGLVLAAGLSIWGVILAVLLDSVGFWVIVIYAVALRHYLPSVLLEQSDTLIQQQLILPMLASFLVGRIITFYVATFFATRTQPWARKTALAGVVGAALAGATGLGIHQYQQQAAIEAARLEAEANAVTLDKLKVQADQAVDDAAKTLDQVSTAAGETANKVAADAKQKLHEACKSTAQALGKSPDDYCQ